MDLEATNPSLFLTTDPNLECSRTENLQNIPLLQSIELGYQLNNSNDNIATVKSVSNSVHNNSHKNLFNFILNLNLYAFSFI